MSAAYAKIIMCLQFQANVPYTILSRDSGEISVHKDKNENQHWIPVILGPLGGTSL